jgi:hypothetical protein
MRKKVLIDRAVPRGPLPEELHPDWLSSAARVNRAEVGGETTERSLRIAR